MGRHLDERVGAQIYLQNPKHDQINELRSHHSDDWCLQWKQSKKELFSESVQWSRSRQWCCRFKRNTTSLISLADNSNLNTLSISVWDHVTILLTLLLLTWCFLCISSCGTGVRLVRPVIDRWWRGWCRQVRKFRCSQNCGWLNWPSFPRLI